MVAQHSLHTERKSSVPDEPSLPPNVQMRAVLSLLLAAEEIRVHTMCQFNSEAGRGRAAHTDKQSSRITWNNIQRIAGTRPSGSSGGG
ncbi:hypothetical protein AOLI_G00299060 [Acnodon oligacanthus]